MLPRLLSISGILETISTEKSLSPSLSQLKRELCHPKVGLTTIRSLWSIRSQEVVLSTSAHALANKLSFCRMETLTERFMNSPIRLTRVCRDTILLRIPSQRRLSHNKPMAQASKTSPNLKGNQFSNPMIE